MNTDLVFTGFDNEGNERLVYKNIAEYIDLINDEKIENLDLETLRFLKETVEISKHTPKFLVKKIYNKDRRKVIDARNILVGRKIIITDLKKTKTGYGLDTVINYEWNNNFYEIDLYQKDGNKEINYEIFETYKNLYDGKKYIAYDKRIPKLKDFGGKFTCVHFGEFITLKDVIKEPVLTKKKVYELANVFRKENI